MGLLKTLIDFVMKLLGMKSEPAGLPAQAHGGGGHAAQMASSEPEPEAAEEETCPHCGEVHEFDLAGFNPETDEDAFFEAQLYMDSEGMIAPNVTITEEDHDRTMRQWGIRDRRHWQAVRDSVQTVLARKYGGIDAMAQRMMNHRMGMTQKLMAKTAASKAASGELNPVEGISLEQWAGINAAIAQGANAEDMLKGQGIDMPRWDKARAEWEARMSRDTTFTVAQIYGDAFQAASKGKYSEYAKEATAARAANRELNMQPPMTLEQYWEILYEQAYGAKQGKDPVEVLKSCSLSVVDWCDLSAFMGYHIHRTAVQNHKQFNEMQKRVEAKFEAKYPGVKADVDISF
ncbi:MAG: hypothetical protein IPG50_14380 [Myxococcales bacterium]|nr:hypothetical protein [Myxococcales bacterium]